MKDLVIEAEQLLIGSLITRPALILEADLQADDFVDELHGYVFSQMRGLYTAQQEFTMADFAGILPEEQFTYLRDLVENVISPSNSSVKEQAHIISQYAERQRMMHAVMSVNKSMSNSEIRSILQSALSGEKKKSLVKSGEDVFREVEESLKLPPEVYKTGLDCLDLGMGGGLYRGFVYGLCGAEKSGKTTLAHTISYNLDRLGTKHLYVALEMGSKYIEQRNISRDLGCNSLVFLNGRDVAKNNLHRAQKRSNVFYLDSPGAILDEILDEAEKSIIRHGITGMILDYWQLVSAIDNRSTEEKHLRDVAQKIADFAKKKNIWVIILAQMNNDGKLFGGGGLKKACEQLYMIKTPDGYPEARYLEMDASRYTIKADIGTEMVPSLIMDQMVGPYFKEL